MGHCSSLFHNPAADQESLNKRISPSDEQMESQQARWNDLRDFWSNGFLAKQVFQ